MSAPAPFPRTPEPEADTARERAMAALRAAKAIDHYDKEAAHANADDALCEFLRSIGHGDMVELYLSVDKWYA